MQGQKLSLFGLFREFLKEVFKVDPAAVQAALGIYPVGLEFALQGGEFLQFDEDKVGDDFRIFLGYGDGHKGRRFFYVLVHG